MTSIDVNRKRMRFECSSLQSICTLAVATTTIVLPRTSCGLIQTTREYKLDFNYDPGSSIGPPMWDMVEADNFGQWSDFGVFTNRDDHDLKIDGNDCASTRRPSPVNLHPSMECDDDHEMLTRQIRSHDCTFEDMTFEIAPNTLRAFMPYDDSTCLRPTIDVSGDLPNEWLFTWLEVHVRSEHVIDGRRFDGEINLIHLGTKDQKKELAVPSISLDASSPFDEPKLQRFLDKWQEIANAVQHSCSVIHGIQASGYNETDVNAPDTIKARLRRTTEQPNTDTEIRQASFHSMYNRYRSLAASKTPLGRFYDASEYYGDDPDSYYANRDRPKSNRRTPTERDSRTLRNSHRMLQTNATNTTSNSLAPRRKMFPYDMWPTIYYYKYKGSITYPPCSEIVRWRVFDEPLKISRRQLRQLSALLDSYVDEETCENKSVVSPSGENYRPLQVLNTEDQEVAHCQQDKYRYWKYSLRYQ